MAAMRSAFGHRRAFGIGHKRQRRVALFNDGGIVELVPAQSGPGGKARYRHQQFGMAIAKVHLALGMAGDQPQQPGHPVPFTTLVDQPLPQHHIAAAFAVNGPRFGMAA